MDVIGAKHSLAGQTFQRRSSSGVGGVGGRGVTEAKDGRSGQIGQVFVFLRQDFGGANQIAVTL